MQVEYATSRPNFRDQSRDLTPKAPSPSSPSPATPPPGKPASARRLRQPRRQSRVASPQQFYTAVAAQSGAVPCISPPRRGKSLRTVPAEASPNPLRESADFAAPLVKGL